MGIFGKIGEIKTLIADATAQQKAMATATATATSDAKKLVAQYGSNVAAHDPTGIARAFGGGPQGAFDGSMLLKGVASGQVRPITGGDVKSGTVTIRNATAKSLDVLVNANVAPIGDAQIGVKLVQAGPQWATISTTLHTKYDWLTPESLRNAGPYIAKLDDASATNVTAHALGTNSPVKIAVDANDNIRLDMEFAGKQYGVNVGAPQ